MYKKVDTGLNFVDREKEILSYWKENGGYFLSRKKRVYCPCLLSASIKISHSSECKTEFKEDNQQDL